MSENPENETTGFSCLVSVLSITSFIAFWVFIFIWPLTTILVTIGLGLVGALGYILWMKYQLIGVFKESHPELSIQGIFMKSQLSKWRRTNLIGGITLVCVLCLTIIFQLEHWAYFAAVAVFYGGWLGFQYWFLKRFLAGKVGEFRWESEMLIRFVLRRKDHTDFTDGNGNPKEVYLSVEDIAKLGLLQEEGGQQIDLGYA